MDVEKLEVDRAEALKMWQKYQSHRHNQNTLDAEIAKIYEAISKGNIVIRALAEIVKAGLGADGLPKLAIARADEKACHLIMRMDGSAQMSGSAWVTGRSATSRYVDFARDSFPGARHVNNRKAAMPHIPPDVRPKRGLQNYHVLWEAVWVPEPPRDPLLLRRIGKTGDIWLVVNGWDLTDVERAVMANHIAADRRN